MANKVGDDHRDDDGERGGEDDTENSSPHAFRSIIIGIKFAGVVPAAVSNRQFPPPWSVEGRPPASLFGIMAGSKPGDQLAASRQAVVGSSPFSASSCN